MTTSNMKLIGVFLIKLWSAQAFSSYFHKMTVGGHFGFPIFYSSSTLGHQWLSYMNLIRALVSQLRETQDLGCGGGGGGVQTKTIISPKCWNLFKEFHIVKWLFTIII